jgi:hypothetical protein
VTISYSSALLKTALTRLLVTDLSTGYDVTSAFYEVVSVSLPKQNYLIVELLYLQRLFLQIQFVAGTTFVNLFAIRLLFRL